jgi:hypothetical protein
VGGGVPEKDHRPQHRIPPMADHRCSPQSQPSNNDTLNRPEASREHRCSTVATDDEAKSEISRIVRCRR